MDVLDLIPLAKRVAENVSREWPGIEADDIEQEILVHVLDNRESLAKQAYDERTLEATLRRVANRYAGRERYAYTFNSAQYVYTPAEVRALFEEAFFDPAAWEGAPTKETDHRLDVASGGVVVALWDLKAAYATLPGAQQAAIRKRYATPDGLTETEFKRITRGIEAACRYLNRRTVERQNADHDGPGSRHPFPKAVLTKVIHDGGFSY